MKRLLLTFAFVLIATSAFAEIADRDVLVAPDGTVYTVATAMSTQTSADAVSVLSLTVQNGSNLSHLTVPSSTSTGFHFGGTLAYDPDSRTLFVLWIHMSGGGSSEILLSSYRDGTWQPAVSIDSQGWLVSSNLRLGITRHVSQLQKDGSYADAPALLLHAVWWDDSGEKEEARYALLPVENGAVSTSSIEVHSLEEYVAPGSEKFTDVDAKFNKEILRHPAIVSSPMQSSVAIVFGDTKTNAIHSVTLQPIADARIHIPGGIGGGGRPPIPAPASFTADWKGPVTVISRGDHLVFANATEKALNYITYTNGTWSTTKLIPLDSHFPAEAALSALDKMASTQ
jgi:hypothetical protein